MGPTPQAGATRQIYTLKIVTTGLSEAKATAAAASPTLPSVVTAAADSASATLPNGVTAVVSTFAITKQDPEVSTPTPVASTTSSASRLLAGAGLALLWMSLVNF